MVEKFARSKCWKPASEQLIPCTQCWREVQDLYRDHSVAAKTVLQQAIAKQAKADIVVIAACGERANEVVEIFTEFPELDDPATGRKTDRKDHHHSQYIQHACSCQRS